MRIGALSWRNIHARLLRNYRRLRIASPAQSRINIPYWLCRFLGRAHDGLRHWNLDVWLSLAPFFRLALLLTSFGIIRLWFGRDNYVSMFRHQIWPFRANLDRRRSYSAAAERCSADSIFVKIQFFSELTTLPHLSGRKNYMAWASIYSDILSNFSYSDSTIVRKKFFHYVNVLSVVDVLRCWGRNCH